MTGCSDGISGTICGSTGADVGEPEPFLAKITLYGGSTGADMGHFGAISGIHIYPYLIMLKSVL